MALRKITLKETGDDWLSDEVEVTRDAVLLILPHPCLNLLSQLVNRAKRDMEFGELIVTAVEISASKAVPSVVVFHLNARQTGVMTGKVTTIEEVGTGVGGDEILNQNVEIDGNQMRVMKALVKASNFIDGFKIV